ncbi:MAG: shikimate kinase, partial [Bacteroidota bacterium]|nr:shikimate kinase [Bacteroidota bacterium]
ESTMLHEVAEFENVIISCGGGTPCFYDNMDYINQQGESVFLKCTPDVLYNHLKMGRTERPLLMGKTPEEVQAYIKEQLTVRAPYYSKAKHTIDVTLMDSYEKIKITVDKIKESLNLD